MNIVAGPWDIDNDGYHADHACVGHSMLEVFRKSPSLYHGRYITSLYPQPSPTPQMEFGQMFHQAVLEGASFHEMPHVDHRTKAGKELYQQHLDMAASEGKVPIDPKSLEITFAMCQGIAANAMVADWLARPGHTEHAIRWQDPATGIWCKAKPDLTVNEVIIDLKTATDPGPEAFARSVAKYGYHRQAAWYIDGVKHALGIRDAMFVHVVCETVPPYECFAYEIEYTDICLARRQNTADLEKLRQCHETGCWASPLSNTLNRICLPRWAWEEP